MCVMKDPSHAGRIIRKPGMPRSPGTTVGSGALLLVEIAPEVVVDVVRGVWVVVEVGGFRVPSPENAAPPATAAPATKTRPTVMPVARRQRRPGGAGELRWIRPRVGFRLTHRVHARHDVMDGDVAVFEIRRGDYHLRGLEAELSFALWRL